MDRLRVRSALAEFGLDLAQVGLQEQDLRGYGEADCHATLRERAPQTIIGQRVLHLHGGDGRVVAVGSLFNPGQTPDLPVVLLAMAQVCGCAYLASAQRGARTPMVTEIHEVRLEAGGDVKTPQGRFTILCVEAGADRLRRVAARLFWGKVLLCSATLSLVAMPLAWLERQLRSRALAGAELELLKRGLRRDLLGLDPALRRADLALPGMGEQGLVFGIHDLDRTRKRLRGYTVLPASVHRGHFLHVAVLPLSALR